jgi:hypothetical protein
MFSRNPIFVFGAPRSGTSWIATLLDSHPETFYLHEPDSVLRGDYFGLDVTRALQPATNHLHAILQCRHSKTTGSRPVFEKSYRSTIGRWSRIMALYGVKSTERIVPAAARLSIPDFADVSCAIPVIKSVGLAGVGPWTHAMPSARAMIIVRHPCGHVASVVGSRAAGRLDGSVPLWWADTQQGRRYGLSKQALASEPAHIQAAWRWVVLNEKAIEDAPQVRLFSYERICENPGQEVRALFDFFGLSWERQTQRYLDESTLLNGGYFDKRRIPAQAANRWRKSFEERDRVLELVKGTRMWTRYQELADV